MEFEASYYPKFWETVVLLLTALELIGMGSIVKRHWAQRNEALPIPLALVIWLVMATLYFLMASAFYQTTEVDRKFTILMYCLLFWTAPLAYFTVTLQQAIALRTIDSIGPFSARIDDPSEFAAARKLALRGDIDGAVARYREYQENQANALFEAARLLKGEDRFEDAAALYQEVAERYYGRRRVWAEAAHNLAKLYEVTQNDQARAMSLYHEILARAPETRFGQLAIADLGRLQVLQGDVAAVPGSTAPAPASPDPFYRPRGDQAPPEAPAEAAPAANVYDDEDEPPRAEQRQSVPRSRRAAPPSEPEPAPAPVAAAVATEGEDAVVVVPPEDPFYRLRVARAMALEAENTGNNHKKGKKSARPAAKTKSRSKPAPKEKPSASRRRKS